MTRAAEYVRSRPHLRVPLKAACFTLLVVAVCFPHPVRLARHLGRLANLQLLIEPHAPELAAWDDDLRDCLGKAARAATAKRPTSPPGDGPALGGLLTRLPPRRVQAEVERFVYERVQYAWDWDTWGNADYVPTVAEMFAMAESRDGVLREDCDGRAVMAASLMRRLGYESSVATDLRHVWVVTPQGEWMGPGREKALVSTPRGNRLALRTALGNVPMSLSYGVAVFPLWRELVILGGAFLLARHRRTPVWAKGLAVLLLVDGLLFLRCGVIDPLAVGGFRAWWPAAVGGLHLASGLGLLAVWSRRARRAPGDLGAGQAAVE